MDDPIRVGPCSTCGDSYCKCPKPPSNAADAERARAFVKAILDCTPTVRRSGNQLSDAHDLLWQAIESLEPDAADPPTDITLPDPVQTLAAQLLDLTRRVDELERTGRAVRQGINNRL